MRKYLDPVYLAVTEEAWRSRTYLEIFMSLNNLLDRIEEVEKNTDSLYQLVKFKASEGLFAEIYNNNPFKNEPKVGDFYAKLFNDKILHQLSRRFEYCPANCKLLTENIQNCSFSNSLVPEDVIFEWNYLMGQCLACDSKELLCLISPNSQPTQMVENGKDVTGDRFLLAHHPDSIFDVEYFLSKTILESSSLRESSLREAIAILYNKKTTIDEWEADIKPQKFLFDDAFWASVVKAKLFDEDREYKQRFINSLTQVVCDIDIDIRKHKYGKISIDGKKYTKYSADVFKMGRGTLDNRCSRIFYCKVKQKIHFYEFDPDFHKGE